MKHLMNYAGKARVLIKSSLARSARLCLVAVFAMISSTVLGAGQYDVTINNTLAHCTSQAGNPTTFKNDATSTLTLYYNISSGYTGEGATLNLLSGSNPVNEYYYYWHEYSAGVYQLDLYLSYITISSNQFYINISCPSSGGGGGGGYTVSFSVGYGTAPSSQIGSSITLPAIPSVCSLASAAGWQPYGWATASVATNSSSATIVGEPGDTYNPDQNRTLYAVYKKAGNELSSSTTFPLHSSGNNASNMPSSGYAIFLNVSQGQSAISNTTSGHYILRAGEGVSCSNSVVTTEDARVVWEISSPASGQYAFRNMVTGKYLGLNSDVDPNDDGLADGALLDAITNYAKWTISTTSDGFYFQNVGHSGYYLRYVSNQAGWRGDNSNTHTNIFIYQPSTTPSTTGDKYQSTLSCVADKYRVYYDAGCDPEEIISGSVPIDNNEYSLGNTVDVAANTWQRSGYTFANWLSSYNENTYAGDGTDWFYMGDEDVTLTAQWNEVVCTDRTLSFANATVNRDYGTAAGKYQDYTINHSGGDVTWDSSDKSVATVTNAGVVTILKAGTTTISVTVAADATYCAKTASYTLNVAAIAPTVTNFTESHTNNTITIANANASTVSNKGGAAITSYGYLYSTSVSTPTYGASGVNEANVGTNDIALNTRFAAKDITELAGGTTYYVRAYAYNGTAYGYSSVVTVTTKCGVTYLPNGGTGTTVDASSPYAKSSNVTVLANGFVAPSGKKFKDWLGSDDNHYVAGNIITSISGDFTLTAQWEDLQYKNYVFACAECDVTTEDSDPVLVTSRNGINIMATKKLVVSTTNAFTGHRIAISGSDLHFYKKTGTGASEHYVELVDANSLTVTGSDQEVYVSYNPTSAGDNAIASPVITVAVDGFTGDVAGLVRARNLPETMVIATKVAGSWYALPANMSSEDVQAGVLISVDETNKIAYGPATLGYKIWPVYTYPTSANDRFGLNSTPAALFGNRVRFADNRADSYKGLHNYSGNNKLNQQAVIDEITDNAGAAYEWKIATSDLDAYTLQADNTNTNYLDVYRPSSGNHKGIISWATNGDYLSNEIHFFELEEVTPVEIIPREWKSNGLIFSIAADNAISLTAGDAKYGIGDAATTDATLTRLSTGGYGLYEVSLPDLTGNYGKVLTLKLKISGSDKYATTTIPIIVSGSKSTKNNEPFSTLGTASADYDVVVLGGNTLTTDATGSGAYKFQNLCLYPGATLANTANGNLYLRHLELRAGIPSYDNLNGALAVPHLYLTKGIAGCTDGATLDMYVDVRHDYALSVPFAVSLANVKYANALKTSDGTAINGALNSQFRVSYYSAEQRATTGKGWVDISSTSTILSPGTGYVIQAKRPSGQPLAVLRFPFTANPTTWADASGEKEKGAISISGYGVDDDNISDNNKGWNLIANPYSANISYADHDESSFVACFKSGYLKGDTVDGKWTGKYVFVEEKGGGKAAYVTIPNDNYTVYTQSRANAVTYEPYKNFFIQASSNEGTEAITFDRTYRLQAPGLLRAVVQITEPLYVDIDLAHESKVVTAGLTIDPDATPGYKFGEDQNIFENRNELSYLKAYTVVDGHYLVGNTLTPNELAMLIPVEFYAPDNASGYVFRINESSDLDNLESLILFDSQAGTATNLLQDDYPFTVDAAGLVEDRFTINVTLKQENNTATDVDAVDETTDKPLKFFYQQKMYILHEGVIYDATGKRVREINK